MIESRQLESYRRPEPCLLVSRLCCCESAQEIVRYPAPPLGSIQDSAVRSDGVKLAVFGGSGLENKYHGGGYVRR